jgi:UDP-glucose 4-epimerase
MRIFITGIAGFLGSHLAERFKNEGHLVAGTDTLIGGYADNVPEGIPWHKFDCGDVILMRELLKETDVVYHTACTAYEGLSSFSPSLIARNTYDNTVAMISASISAGVKRFVYLSSMARYGTQEILPFFEEQIPAPQDPYGISKYASELVLRNLCETHGMEFVIAVPHNIIGPRQKYDDPYRNVVAIFINLMLQGRSPIIYGDGLQERCFSYIDDVVDPLMKMATETNVIGQVINIGPDKGEVTINELYKLVADATGYKANPVYLPDRPREVKIAHCSAEKARHMLGYEAKTDLVVGITKMVDWIKERGVKPFEYHLPLEIVNDKIPRTWKEKLY